MTQTGTPQVVREFIDDTFDPHAPVRVLRWQGGGERLWELPEGLCVTGPAPTRLGVSIRRGGDGFAVRLLWDRTTLCWASLSKVELLGSCLGSLLSALGLDLWSMLDTPAPRLRLRAA